MKKIGTTCILFCIMLTARSQNSDTVTAATIVIRPEKPLAVKDSMLRKAVSEWSENELENTKYKKIKAHPSAAIFPGAVKEGYSFTKRSIRVQHQQIRPELVPIVSRLDYSSPWANNLYSTGLYAVAGEYIEVKIPAALRGKEVAIQIGSHSDRLNRWVAGKEDWRRMPIIVKQQVLTETTTRLTSPFGGLIYISFPPRSDSWQEEITIDHAIAAPLFQLNKTTTEEWLQQLKDNKAPWGELATGNVILTLPDSILQKVNDPVVVMKLWDLIIAGEMDLAQIPLPYYRPQRLVIDEHIGGGFMHSGYPIMVHHSPVRKLLSANVIANPLLLMQPSKGGANWGFFHEIGHNMQNQDWVFGGTTEVSCNFFSLYMFDRLLGGRDEAHSGIENAHTQKMMRTYFQQGKSYEKWKKDPFLALVLFRQLQEAFGWESFKTFFREYQQLAIKDASRRSFSNDQQKRDTWVKTFSMVTNRNVATFFETWGIPISDTVKQELAGLKEWLPYNFPPIN